MISENARNYENVVIRNEQEIGINNFGLDYMVGLEDEIERLNNIIKEAIEYLKDNACYNDMGNFNDDLDYDKCGDLLDILKGSDKE